MRIRCAQRGIHNASHHGWAQALLRLAAHHHTAAVSSSSDQPSGLELLQSGFNQP
jgi:hypothetical protein